MLLLFFNSIDVITCSAITTQTLLLFVTEGSSEVSSDEEFFGHRISVTKPVELNSPDSIAEAILPLVNVQSPDRSDVKRHPSPYYYADLFKNRPEETLLKPSARKQNKSEESDGDLGPIVSSSKLRPTNKKYRKSSSLDNSNLDKPVRSKEYSQLHYKKSSSVDNQRYVPDTAMPPNRLTTTCSCITPDHDLDDDMMRQRHVYETAFDCRIAKSDDDLEELEKVTNHPVLFEAGAASSSEQGRNRKVTLVCPSKSDSVTRLAQNLQEMHLPVGEISAALPLRGYTPSPPSTAPLPNKFHGRELGMNSIRSAPNLPHTKARLKDLHLPVKSLRGRSPTSSSGSLQTQGSAFDIEFGNYNSRTVQAKEHAEKDRVLEIKDRPRKNILLLKKGSAKEMILEFKGRCRRPKYSSTESMTTSSSGGSMESIKSSTSEGNRSTTSCESRHSSSLSSHSSDSGGNMTFSSTQNSVFMAHANKLHILSPISDKSSQEPASETSDNNKNNNSQKCSPEEVITPESMRTKRRIPQNRNLLNLGFHPADKEIQGSDSGISIHSREGIRSKFEVTAAELSAPSQPDFSNLPFDMPKLRRKKMITQEACTSGSATSVDLKDLPFDMPKLRRKLRVQQQFTTDSSASQASSSQSVVETDRQGR